MKKADHTKPDVQVEETLSQAGQSPANMADQVNEWKEKYLRALADYQNLERRMQAEKTEIRNFAAQALIERLLPVADVFERAQTHLQDAGLGLALKQLFAVLAERGVERIVTVGKPFDPHEMECVDVVPGEENIVVDEFAPGYRLHGRVIRAAQVKVGSTAQTSTK